MWWRVNIDLGGYLAIKGKSVKPFSSKDLDSYLIRNDYIHFIYSAILLDWPFEKVERFLMAFKEEYRIELPLDGIIKVLSNNRIKLPFNLVFNALNFFEAFCYSNNIDPFAFIKKSFVRLGGVASRPPVILSAYMSVYMHVRYKKMDLRDVILDLAEKINKTLRKGTTFKCVRKQTSGSSVKGVLAFGCDGIPFSNFEHINCELYFAMATLYAPLRFGGITYDSFVKVLLDCRSVFEIVDNYVDVENKNDQLILNGKCIAVKKSLYDYLRELGYNLSEFNFAHEDTIGYVLLADFCLPGHQNISLHEGAFYGASFYMYEMSFTKEPIKVTSLFHKLFKEASFPATSEWDKVDRLHQDFCTFLQNKQKLAVTFDSKVEAILVNNQKVTKGDTAIILYYVFEQYAKFNRDTFTNKELIHELFQNSGVTNGRFKTALKRLKGILEKKLLGVDIASLGDGMFKLVVQGEIVISEYS